LWLRWLKLISGCTVMKTLTIEQLQRDAPELYHAILYRGIMTERGRVLAHLNVAKMYNSLREAIGAVKSGDEAVTKPGDIIPYGSLHNRYSRIEDERDRLEEIAG